MSRPEQDIKGIRKAFRALLGEVRGVEASVTHVLHEPVSVEGPTEPLHPAIAFEHSDIAARWVVIGGYGVLIGAGIVTFLLYFYFSYLAHDRARSSPPPLAIEAHGNPLPPAPRLQDSPRRDLEQMRVFENSVLGKYWWVDQSKGVVGLPIDRAMDLLLERGIPPQKAPADLKLFPPETGDRSVGFEGKVAPEPR